MNLPQSSYLAILVSPFIGSFLGMLAYRLPRTEPWFFSRSKCAECWKQLKIWEMIPIVSFLLRRGKCGACDRLISPDYLWLEFGAIGVAIWAFVVLPTEKMWFGCILGWLLLLLSMVDVRHLILPNAVTLMLFGVGLALALTISLSTTIDFLLAALIGYALFMAIKFGYKWVRGKDGLGYGDVKLMAAGGVWVGLSGLLSVLLIACMSALVTIVLMKHWSSDAFGGDAVVPFGPFLSLGIWVTWLHGPLNFV